MFHLLEGPDVGHTNDRIEKRRKNAQHLVGFELTSSLSGGVCPTTVVQQLPDLR